MTRPQYESPIDLINENSVIEKMAKMRNLSAIKLPSQYRIDYALSDISGIRYWVEVKCRNTASNSYHDYMISMSKWISGKRYYLDTGIDFLLAIRFTNGDYVIKYSDEIDKRIKYIIKGRTIQTRDEDDIEPVAMIPMELFKAF
jgi:hypothetical protein